ncbi:hypothetical protein [Herbaspirillum autotrophicum]|uniref:hypothetical protein n=1 Tax=Herbaspirillum autotrophicum TaxID=180195 RepID=UPI00067DC378|nr:hypothetical protein [Herbaspirillum autotrophicum]
MTTENIKAACVELVNRLLSSEQFGYAVTAEVRDEARKALGRAPVEQALYLNAPPAADTHTCKCNLRTKLVGDGCNACNPEYAARFAAPADHVRGVTEMAPDTYLPTEADHYCTIRGGDGAVCATGCTCGKATEAKPVAADGNPMKQKSVFLSNLVYFYGQTDGTYKWPVGPVADLLKQAKHEIEAIRQEARPVSAGLSRQQVFDKFSFLEGVVNEFYYNRIAETAIAMLAAPQQPVAEAKPVEPYGYAAEAGDGHIVFFKERPLFSQEFLTSGVMTVHPLYTAQQQPAPAVGANAVDAQRWRTTLRFVGAYRFVGCHEKFHFETLPIEPGTKLMRGSAAGHFTKAIDAAIALQAGEQS